MCLCLPSSLGDNYNSVIYSSTQSPNVSYIRAMFAKVFHIVLLISEQQKLSCSVYIAEYCMCVFEQIHIVLFLSAMSKCTHVDISQIENDSKATFVYNKITLGVQH